MTNTFRPWQLLSVIVAGMLNEQQQQGIGNVLIQPPEVRQSINDPVHCSERLGGLLRSYETIAA